MQGPGEAAKGVASSRADRLRRGGRHPHDKRLGVEYIVWRVDFLLALGATLCGMAGPASSCMRHPCGVGAYEIDAAGIVTGTGVDELDDLERLGGPSWARLLSHPVLSNSQRLSFVGKSPVSLVKRLKSAESDLRDRSRPRSRGCGEHWTADHRRQAACQGQSDAEGCQVFGGWWDATLNSKCCNGICRGFGFCLLGDAVSMPQLDECKRAKRCLSAVELEGCYRGQSMY